MSQEKWAEVDDYFSDLFVKRDSVLDTVLANSKDAGLPAINVSACQGMFLKILAMMNKSQRILEIGTLGGYSAIWLARGLSENGSLVTIEAIEKHALVATENLKLAGLSGKVTIINADAAQALQKMVDEKTPPFDFIFIDADKPGYPVYLELVLKLSRKGTVIVSDNVVRRGEVTNPSSEDKSVQGVQKFCEILSKKEKLTSTAIQTVGCKGYDGFSITIV